MMMEVVMMEPMTITASSHQGHHTARTLRAKLDVCLKSPAYHPSSHTIIDSTELSEKNITGETKEEKNSFSKLQIS